jgi:hypothetical protein
MPVKSNMSPTEKSVLMETLKSRFEKNSHRHRGIDWSDVASRINNDSNKLTSLHLMEATGGEPDVIAFDKKINMYLFVDCSPESPAGRRSLCYDKAGMLSRKEHLPVSTAMDMALEMGIELLTQEQYEWLQQLGNFDTKTSSWLKTPEEMRKLGGALFGDRRFNRVFVYHNGAQSYYGGRGFRGALWV